MNSKQQINKKNIKFIILSAAGIVLIAAGLYALNPDLGGYIENIRKKPNGLKLKKKMNGMPPLPIKRNQKHFQ